MPKLVTKEDIMKLKPCWGATQVKRHIKNGLTLNEISDLSYPTSSEKIWVLLKLIKDRKTFAKKLVAKYYPEHLNIYNSKKTRTSKFKRDHNKEETAFYIWTRGAKFWQMEHLYHFLGHVEYEDYVSVILEHLREENNYLSRAV